MDSRFPTYYLTDRRIMRMTPEQFRFFVLATAWSVSNMTDGHIPAADLPLIPFATEVSPGALVDLGLWDSTEGGWTITDFAKTQTSAAQAEAALRNRRKADAERQRKKYERDKSKEDESPDSAPSNQLSREPHVSFEGKERQGKERQGSLRQEPSEVEYPTDPRGVEYRQKIEENNFRSVDDLMKAQPMTLVQAEKIWALAYPGRSVA